MRYLFLLVLMLTGLMLPADAATPVARANGMFVTVVQEPFVLCDPSATDRLLDTAKVMQVDTVFMQVYRANQSWFPSQHADASPYAACAQKAGGDPLALFIDKAHHQGIRVHAWMNLLSLAKNKDAPMLKKFGTDILTRNIKVKTRLEDYRVDDQYFLEPGDANVRGELLAIVGELLTAYKGLDGIQFDYIRYPDKDPAYGYTRVNMERFKKAAKKALINEQDPDWRRWKRDQVTGLLTRLVTRARALHPGIKVSTTGCAPYVRAYDEAFQDWPGWLNSGLVDLVTVMTYTRTPDDFGRLIADARSRVKDPSRMGLAVGAYDLMRTPKAFAAQMQMCRESGNGPCVIFHYGSLADAPALTASPGK